MSTGSSKKTRTHRATGIDVPPSLLARAIELLRDVEVLKRIALCVVSAVVMYVGTVAWHPPLPFREGQTPQRNIVARVTFQLPDPEATREAQSEARRQSRHVYGHNPERLVQLRATLKSRVVELLEAKDYAAATELWDAFFKEEPSAEEVPPAEISLAALAEKRKELYEAFKIDLAAEGRLGDFEDAIGRAFVDIDERGLITGTQIREDLKEEGNQSEIYVFPVEDPTKIQTVQIQQVRIAEVSPVLLANLEKELASPDLAARTHAWLERELPNNITLTHRSKESLEKKQEAVAAVEDVFKSIEPGEVLAQGGVAIGSDSNNPQSMQLLLLEHEAMRAHRGYRWIGTRLLATFGMYLAMFTLCGVYIFYRHPHALKSFGRFAAIVILSTFTVITCYWLGVLWQASMIAMLLFGMAVAIAYHQELALLLSAAVGLICVFSLGQALPSFVILMASSSTAILLLGRIRSRTKLIYVGLCAGAVAALTTVGANVAAGDPLSWQLLQDAAWYGLGGVISGFVMTGLLPFIENAFGVLTDISLLELGDVAHPLLQELVRRAPGTYNHSINVAALSEAAAESIGASGLLVRVGAYFHDIGKMLKPQYFVENQGEEGNRHESLVPAMSTLIIIAHVKDGADLGHQHHLPQPIIDFIQQHHGTTLVEYFYHRANEESEGRNESGEVDESTFRYPGPKPQSREAGILMLSDAVESASRVLVEPTPARIESLVEDMAMKRLMDGQLDECGLTLREVRTVEESLIKSLTSVFHSRVKYPDQKTA